MTQHERIYHYMKDFGSITTYQAFTDLGVTYLTTRISEMRRKGIRIEQKKAKAKNRYGDPVEYMVYSLSESE